MEGVYKAAADGAVLVVTTGNKGALTSVRAGTMWGDSWEAKEHYLHVSPKALRSLLTSSGFAVLSMSQTSFVQAVLMDQALGSLRTRALWGRVAAKLLSLRMAKAMVLAVDKLALGQQPRSAELLCLGRRIPGGGRRLQ